LCFKLKLVGGVVVGIRQRLEDRSSHRFFEANAGTLFKTDRRRLFTYPPHSHNY